jgi:hypothetical protein
VSDGTETETTDGDDRRRAMEYTDTPVSMGVRARESTRETSDGIDGMDGWNGWMDDFGFWILD